MKEKIVDYICPNCGMKSTRIPRKGVEEKCRRCGSVLFEDVVREINEDGELEHAEKKDIKRKVRQLEAEQQELLFEWAKMAECTRPELKLMHHIPNGGSRNSLEGANLKKQGVKAGVPDVHLPVASGQYHSLYIEMKVKPNKPTPEQIKWLAELSKQGNRAVVCYSWEEARAEIENYLNLEKENKHG